MLACVIGAALVYLSGDLFTQSMSLDGIVYAGLSLNLANEHAGVWMIPHFDAAAGFFYDHPPLGIWLQSLWFQILGESFWVERLYCMVVLALICALLLVAWRRINEGSLDGAAWVLTLFLLMPVVTRTAKNNLLELPLTLVTMAAVIFAWESRRRTLASPLVGVLVAIGILIKGPVALFPLAAPLVFAVIVDRQFRHGIYRSTLATLTCSAVIGGLMLSEPAREAIGSYLHQQLFASLAGERPAVHDRLYLANHIAINLLPAVLLTVFVTIKQGRGVFSSKAMAWLSIGLIASLPLLISPRQFRHYLFPSLPYFALAAAMIARPRIYLNARWAQIGAALLLITALIRGTLTFAEPGKDATVLRALSEVATVAEEQGQRLVGFCTPEPMRQAYLLRYHGLRTDTRNPPALPFAVCPSQPDASFTRVLGLTEGFSLWVQHPGQTPPS